MKLRRLFWRLSADDGVDEELRAHIDELTARYVADGMPPDAARTAALQRFGNPTSVRDACRALAQSIEADMRRAEFIADLKQDLGYALRILRRAPLFTAVAVITLAIGIGANTAIFTVVDAVLVRGLPYQHAASDIVIWNDYGTPGMAKVSVSMPEFADLKDQLKSMDVAGLRWQAVNFGGNCVSDTDACDAERVNAYSVSPNIFTVLGAQPAMGHAFSEADGAQGAEPVILISHALWVRRFGRDEHVLDRRVTISGVQRRIIGVMPEGVRFPDAALGFLKVPAEVWVPFAWERGRAGERGNQIMGVIGRVHDGVSLAAAQSELDRVAADFRARFADRYAQAASKWRLSAVPLRAEMVGDIRTSLLLLMGAVSLVLLIACANVANLMLARGASREREFAVRASLGAGRVRLARQLITESVVLGFGGGALGVGLAFLATRALVSLDAASVLPRADAVRVNGTVLAFSLAISIVSSVLFGLAPALQFSRADLSRSLRRGGRAGSIAAGRRFRQSLVIAEVALTLVILVGAALLGRSFAALQHVHTGVDGASVVVFQVAPAGAKYPTATEARAYHRDLQARVAAVPGVERVALGYPLPMGGEGWGGSYYMATEDPGRPEYHAEYGVAAPGYFGTLRVPIIAGRDFGSEDATDGPQNIIVDDVLATRHWGTAGNAIGKLMNPNNGPGKYATIVGVVGHVRKGGPHTEGEPQIYMPLAQNAIWRASYVVRSNGDPRALFGAIRQAVKAVDPAIAVAQLTTMNDVIASATAKERFNAVALIGFAVAALLLASVGLYGVMAYLVTQRMQEIGIRLALGGQPRQVVRLVLAEGLRMSAAGIGIGLVLAAALSRTMHGLVFGVTETDVATYAGVAVLLAVVAMCASYIPARRATRIDPLLTLRGS